MGPENLSRCAGEVETRGVEGEGDRVGTQHSFAACQSDHPRIKSGAGSNRAPRALLSPAAGEVLP